MTANYCGETILAPSRPAALPKFDAADAFHQELRRRVEGYFASTGKSPRDSPAMYRKAAVIALWLSASYALLVFAPLPWWLAAPLAASLGLAMAALGFNVQHDGGHRAASDRPWVNRLAALAIELIGGSSYVWHHKHNVIHHTYVNITGHDDDVAIGPLGRLTPHQRWRPWHRFQHWYLWPLYGLLAVKWHLLDDFVAVLRGRVGAHRIPRPRGGDLAGFLAGKGVFLALAFGVPLLLHPWWAVLPLYALTAVVLGLTLSVVFQMAHCVEPAAFPLPGGRDGRMAASWAVHQVETTVDFARHSRVVGWLTGGLNFQIEHHLFPRVCHVHYPALSPIVEQTCREFGVRYAAHETFRAGLASHYRWLRRMATRPAPEAAAST